jgi:hypothetical protein
VRPVLCYYVTVLVRSNTNTNKQSNKNRFLLCYYVQSNKQSNRSRIYKNLGCAALACKPSFATFGREGSRRAQDAQFIPYHKHARRFKEVCKGWFQRMVYKQGQQIYKQRKSLCTQSNTTFHHYKRS